MYVYPAKVLPYYPFAQTAAAFIHYTLFAIGFWHAKRIITSEKKLQQSLYQLTQLNHKQFEMQKTKFELENSILRNQINPHFLFNTLGLFHNKAFDSHPDISEKILTLTEILRSSIKKTDNKVESSLDEVCNIIENYISVYEYQNPGALQISFIHNAYTEVQVIIAPYMLFTEFMLNKIMLSKAPQHMLFELDQGNDCIRLSVSLDTAIATIITQKELDELSKIMGNPDQVNVSYITPINPLWQSSIALTYDIH